MPMDPMHLVHRHSMQWGPTIFFSSENRSTSLNSVTVDPKNVCHFKCALLTQLEPLSEEDKKLDY